MTTPHPRITRRHALGLLGGLSVAGGAGLLTGCRSSSPPTSGPANLTGSPAADGTGVVLADTRDGLVGVRGGQTVRYGPAAIVTGDGGLVYATEPLDGGARTALLTYDPVTGSPPERLELDGGWVPRVTSSDSRMVVLTGTGGSGPGGRPAPRARSPILVSRSSRELYRFDLAGSAEPDALTYEGHGLFVLEWLPPEAPDRYRVRLLDFNVGQPQPLFTREKQPVPAGAEEEMRGDGRQAVLSGARNVLYTLYTHQPDHRHTRDLVAGRPGGVHAFVHVLQLAELWAYCLDLPHPFGESPPSGHALVLSFDMRRLLVADTGSGRLAIADIESLTVSRVVEIPPGKGAATMAAAPDGRIFLASGGRLLVLDGATGAVTDTWSPRGTVNALAVGRDGARLYVATPGNIDLHDSATGRHTGRIPVAGVTALLRAP
jgi:hypothetical protein